jgi:hypothetical protein
MPFLTDLWNSVKLKSMHYLQNMLTFLSGRNYAAPLLISRPEHGSESENGEYEEDEERARAMEGFEIVSRVRKTAFLTSNF